MEDETFMFLAGVTAATVFIFFFLFMFGTFDTPWEELGISSEEIGGDYILSYYPEFENYSLEYFPLVCGEVLSGGFKIYSVDNRFEDRDGLKILNNPFASKKLITTICLERGKLTELAAQKMKGGYD
jgi:hypothetical protein